MAPRSVPSCTTWALRPRSRGRRSELPCRPRISISAPTCSGGTSLPTSLGVSGAGIFPRKREVPPPTSGAWAGFVYLATVLDCCTKKVVGYAMADHMHTSLVCEAIDMAAKRCPVEKGVTVFPLRPGKSVHVSEVSGPPEGLWYPAVRGSYGGVLGQCVGGII